MKQIIKPMLFVFLLMISLVSCNNEELFVENAIVEDTEEPTTPEDNNTSGEDTATTPPVTTPCDFNLNNVAANATVIINCVMDLGGQSITLPAGVTLVYEGGDIVNGTINFGSSNIVSGELLNSSLTISGTKPQMKDTTFHFDPQRWGIVEGEVSQSVAKSNSKIIHDLIFSVKELGIKTFSIDKLDAYFYGETRWSYIFEMPSDFNLIMTDNTHLRVFPTNTIYTVPLIMILNATNVTVTGGNLYGDRDDHDYSSGGTHEFGHLILIKTGINIKIENVLMRDAIGDGLNVESYRLRNDPLFERGSSNVLITGCTFDSNRRNNLSITDGEDIIIENCTFLNAGIATANSMGTAPRSAIDIEPDIHDYNNPWQLVNRVIIRNNIESGPHNGLIVFTGNDVLVTGNTFDNDLSVSRGFNVKITNNSARSISAGILEITDPRNYEVSGNTVSNPSGSGIFAANPGVQIFNNTINNCKSGIQLRNLNDANIYNNTINGNEDGINVFNGGNNVLIKDNIINVNRPFFFQGANSFTISNNTINSSSFGYFQLSSNFKILNNNFINGIRLESSSDAIIQSNSFDLNNGTAINVRGENSNNIEILSNTLKFNVSSAYGIYNEGNASWGDRNIIINNNVFINTGIFSRNFSGLTVNNNNGNLNNGAYIDYQGNNSYFESNRGLTQEIVVHKIQGSNNTIID